jgi:mono/diheme cytochrome c family protein
MIILIALAITIVYILSSLIMSKTYNVPLSVIHIPDDTISVREGERLVRIEHCGDCHGLNFTGRVYRKIDYVAQLAGPNITTIIPGYSNEELERLIRHGVKKNGKSVYAMPSAMYYQLKDESIEKIIAYLRTLKPVLSSPEATALTYYPLGRLQIIQGKIKPVAATINHNAPRQFANYDTSQTAFGKYLVMTACSNCHGKDLKGNALRNIPNLIIVSAYNKDQFRHLLKTGEGGLNKKELGLMSEMGKNYLCYLNDKEINAIYVFLKTLPSQKN